MLKSDLLELLKGSPDSIEIFILDVNGDVVDIESSTLHKDILISGDDCLIISCTGEI